ncbi:MAG TPA: flagellar hook-basal body complex protein FliE [Clostridiales bacterium]|nr:flagellar hook-basal body complex protein FliE [Clostridiales bacterium]
MDIGAIDKSLSISSLKKTGIQRTEDGIKGFADYFKEAVNKTNDIIVKAENISNQFAVGNIDDIHKVLVEVEKADIALQFTLQIRNKIMDAYNEIMRMQI